MFGFRSKFDGAGGGGGRRASQTADTVDQSEHSAYMKTGFVLIRPYSSLIGNPGIETSVSAVVSLIHILIFISLYILYSSFELQCLPKSFFSS